MAERQLKLRYPAACATCSNELTPGTSAWWNSTAKQATCVACRSALPPPPQPTLSPPPSEAPRPPVNTGTAGASAERMYVQREQAREERIRAQFPRIGPTLLRIAGEPQSSTAWKKGASGERRVGQRLDAVAEDGVITLHDRRIPGTRGNIDHISIGPTGIYVIDSKKYKGQIQRRDVGGLFKRDERLYVGGRDRTVLAQKVGAQATVVKDTLGGHVDDRLIWPVLCFVDPEVGMFTRPFNFRGVRVTWPRALQKQVRADGPLSDQEIHAIATWLAAALPPA